MNFIKKAYLDLLEPEWYTQVDDPYIEQDGYQPYTNSAEDIAEGDKLFVYDIDYDGEELATGTTRILAMDDLNDPAYPKPDYHDANDPPYIVKLYGEAVQPIDDNKYQIKVEYIEDIPVKLEDGEYHITNFQNAYSNDPLPPELKPEPEFNSPSETVEVKPGSLLEKNLIENEKRRKNIDQEEPKIIYLPKRYEPNQQYVRPKYQNYKQNTPHFKQEKQPYMPKYEQKQEPPLPYQQEKPMEFELQQNWQQDMQLDQLPQQQEAHQYNFSNQQETATHPYTQEQSFEQFNEPAIENTPTEAPNYDYTATTETTTHDYAPSQDIATTEPSVEAAVDTSPSNSSEAADQSPSTEAESGQSEGAVSYTHLTLPTIYSV